MEYPKKSVNGDAGEYFVAYRITKLFGWPCRLFGIDIGVDAELEILDSQSASTGNVIKIQIKSFDKISSLESKSIYVDDSHISYWKKFCLPVIICCVDLSSEKIYWKQIRATEAYQSGGSSRKISIDLVTDELCAASRVPLSALATPEESKKIEPLFLQLKKLYGALIDKGTPMCVDGALLSSIERNCNEIDSLISQIENLILHFPWRVGAMDISLLETIKRNIQITRNNANQSFAISVNGM